ncbi:MAG: Gfo/Idh/MocA family oxidoreductase [Kordiimonadaceae bacterium]|jgi:predicted dehydrogenase|nr:Gfo/Idh/MocA family oxidoreductase [Kordiimonadaceae bacterium]MBT6033276.1 Gfo/Idh/MocA family oxidoreductase [Kordiimonadaceae bacterium]
MNEVRLGIIGLGNIGKQHLNHVVDGLIHNCEVSAVCSRQKPTFELPQGVKHYCDYKKLINSGDCDAVLVATPSYNHCEIGGYALDKGLHVLMEKPIGLSVLEGEKVISKVKKNQIFAMMLNQRTDPIYAKMKNMVSAGSIGAIQRSQWTATHWFRPEIYFAVSDWRATWRGEGGGLLVNQCIHNLDTFQWICGMPSEVNGHCEYGKYHDIEVEDEATAYFKYNNGATGVFVASTGEVPGINRFDIVGDLGMLSTDSKTLTFTQNEISTAKFSKNTHDMFSMPGTTITDVTPPNSINQHATIINNFVAAILNREPLIAPANEGINSMALANSILLSSWQNKPIEIPIDSKHFQTHLNQYIEKSTFREKANIDAVIELDKSYR